MNSNYYMIFAGIGILVSLLILFFSIPNLSKIFDDEDFVLQRYDVKKMRSLLLNFAGVIFSVSALLLFSTWLLGLFSGFVFTGAEDLEIRKLIFFPLFLGVVIPLFIFLVLSILKTRRLAKQGHKVAGYFSSKINGRFTLLSIQFLFSAILFILLYALITFILFPREDGSVRRDIFKGLIHISPFVFYMILICFIENIINFIMRKVLGEYFNTDYRFPIKQAREVLGMSEDDFYRKMFTKKQLKILEKEKRMKNEK